MCLTKFLNKMTPKKKNSEEKKFVAASFKIVSYPVFKKKTNLLKSLLKFVFKKFSYCLANIWFADKICVVKSGVFVKMF